jgi:hypothetical protein
MRAEQLNYFNEVIKRIKQSVNVSIPILPADHEKIKGHENALGICHGRKNIGQNDWEPEKITIDEYFIEENYEADVNGKTYMLRLVGENLVEVICHEIAHIQEWRHGKRHRNLTKKLIELVETGKQHGIVQENAA